MEVTDRGDKEANVGAAVGVGIACAVLIYMSLFIYGAQVMRGVIEEKTNRIIEVIISSVKPFQLMLGKIIGVGMVGLTQFILWIVISIVLSMVGGTILVKNAVHTKTEQVSGMQHSAHANARAVQQPDNSMAVV